MTQEPTQDYCPQGAILRAKYQAAIPAPTREYDHTLRDYFKHINACPACKAARNEALAARLYVSE